MARVYQIIIAIILIVLINFSLESVYKYNKVKQKTLKYLDLKKLEGKWHTLYHRRFFDKNSCCPVIEIYSNDTILRVKKRSCNSKPEEFDLEQNEYLRGKLSRSVETSDGYALEFPWWVLIAFNDDNIVVIYQVINDTQSEDEWGIYGRHKSFNASTLTYGSKVLRDAGAWHDTHLHIGYQCDAIDCDRINDFTLQPYISNNILINSSDSCIEGLKLPGFDGTSVTTTVKPVQTTVIESKITTEETKQFEQTTRRFANTNDFSGQRSGKNNDVDSPSSEIWKHLQYYLYDKRFDNESYMKTMITRNKTLYVTNNLRSSADDSNADA